MTYEDDAWRGEREYDNGRNDGYYEGVMSTLPTNAEVCARDEECRQRAIRAVVAAQWAMAIALFASPPWSPFRTTWSFVDYGYEIGGVISNLAALPCAVEVVDGGDHV